RTLAQELGVRGDREREIGPGLADDPLDLVAGADRHGRLGHHHGARPQVSGHLLGGGIDVAEVRMSVAAARRRADRNEHRIGIRQRAGKVERELEPFSRDVALDQLVQSRLEDRNAPLAQRRDLAGILVDAAHVMPEIRKARTRYKADVARADHHYAHAGPQSFSAASMRAPSSRTAGLLATRSAAAAIRRDALIG